jgi:hypothetical protein
LIFSGKTQDPNLINLALDLVLIDLNKTHWSSENDRSPR